MKRQHCSASPLPAKHLKSEENASDARWDIEKLLPDSGPFILPDATPEILAVDMKDTTPPSPPVVAAMGQPASPLSKNGNSPAKHSQSNDSLIIDEEVVAVEGGLNDLNITSPEIPKGFIDLGNAMLAGVNTFQNRINVHIRQYRVSDGKLIPTKDGIAMSHDTWVRTRQELPSFKYWTISESLVIDQRLFFCVSEKANCDRVISVQYLFGIPLQLSRTNVQLSQAQFQKLINGIGRVSRNINDVEADEGFRIRGLGLLANAPRSNAVCVTDGDLRESLNPILRDAIFDELLKPNMYECYSCEGCIERVRDCPLNVREHLLSVRFFCDECRDYKQNPLKHTCPFAEKVDKHFDRVLASLDVGEIARLFVDKNVHSNRQSLRNFFKFFSN